MEQKQNTAGRRKVVLIGTGLVGMSYAYALLNQGVCEELVLIDIDRRRAQGEAMDLGHGLAFASKPMLIAAGDYRDCADADIVAIAAGVAQKSGESRIDLLRRNAAIFQSIVTQVTASGFAGIFLVASNPVDIMARLTQQISGFPATRVIGTGTTLDTARLRYLIGGYFGVDPRNVHAYVMGEHGDTEFVPWSQALIATKPLLNICDDHPALYRYEDLLALENEVRGAAHAIIAAKKATYYGIGMAMVRITRAIFGDENSILTISAHMEGEYGQTDVYAGSPCILGRRGVKNKVCLTLHSHELRAFGDSCAFLREVYSSLGIG